MKRLLICGVLVLVFLLTIPVVHTSHAQQKVVTLRYSAYHPAASANSALCDQWCKEVEKRTSGRVKPTYFPGGILTPPAQTFDSVIKGIADIGFSMASFTKGRFPLTEVADLPLGYESATQATRLVNSFYRKFKPKEFDDVKVLYMGASPLQRFFTKNKPVNKVDDVKGLKIRGTGNSSRIIQLLGGAPVGLPITEVYDSLSRGVIEGVITSYEPMKDYKLAEVIGYATEFQGTATVAGYTVMNKQKWESISLEDQKTIEAINDEWIEKQAKIWEVGDQTGKDLLLQRKGKIIKLSKEEDARWTKTLNPMLEEYVTTMKAKGLPGDEAVKFCMEELKKLQ
jgi:TRAP-type C4-dicarboxylate transport system substrate-binding protein